MKHVLQSKWGSSVALICNILGAYVLYFIARLIYVFSNWSYFSEGFSGATIGQWIKGSLLFDTTAIVYTHIPYVLLMLFPLWIKEQPGYQKLCKWVFVGINSVA